MAPESAAPPELRVDPLSGARVVIASDPAWAPAPAGAAAAPAAGPAPWRPDAPDPPRDSHPDLFGAAAARGERELLELPGGATSLLALDATALAATVEGWRERMRAHPDAAALHLAAEEVPGAPARVELHVLAFVPAALARERERWGAHATRTMGSDLLGDLVQEEVRRRARLVAYDADAVLLAPWASRTPFHLLLAPRRPATRFEAEGEGGAGLLHDALQRLQRRFGGPVGVDLLVRTAPRGADRFTWRIELLPRLHPASGLEVGAGVAVNPVAPERAAAELKAAT